MITSRLGTFAGGSCRLYHTNDIGVIPEKIEALGQLPTCNNPSIWYLTSKWDNSFPDYCELWDDEEELETIGHLLCILKGIKSRTLLDRKKPLHEIIKLCWVSGHRNIVGTKMADELARGVSQSIDYYVYYVIRFKKILIEEAGRGIGCKVSRTRQSGLQSRRK